jgi:HSP20 family molecular chaperone IbpA
VEVKGIRAESKEGVLSIHIPRMPHEKVRPLAISVQ